MCSLEFTDPCEADGDMYNLINVTKIPELLPPNFDEPANYLAPGTWETEETATVRDIADFYGRFMMAGESYHALPVESKLNNVLDSLGLISVRHRLWADQSRFGARDPKCMKLSEQHSTAVDFPKVCLSSSMPVSRTDFEHLTDRHSGVVP